MDDALPAHAWMNCQCTGSNFIWDQHGYRISAAAAALISSPAGLHYGAPPGSPGHRWVEPEEVYGLLGFELTTQIIAETPDVVRDLPMDLLSADAMSDWSQRPTEAEERMLRTGRCHQMLFVAEDEWGGNGLFAAAELPGETPIGVYGE